LSACSNKGVKVFSAASLLCEKVDLMMVGGLRLTVAVSGGCYSLKVPTRYEGAILNKSRKKLKCAEGKLGFI
jgi:hypothetical protein